MYEPSTAVLTSYTFSVVLPASYEAPLVAV